MSQRKTKNNVHPGGLPGVPKAMSVYIPFEHVGTVSGAGRTKLTYQQALPQHLKDEGKHGVRIQLEIAHADLPPDLAQRRKVVEEAVGRTLCQVVERRILGD